METRINNLEEKVNLIVNLLKADFTREYNELYLRSEVVNQVKELTDSVEELKRQMNLLIQLFELKEEIEYNKYDSKVLYNINSEIERIDDRIRSVEWEIERKL